MTVGTEVEQRDIAGALARLLELGPPSEIIAHAPTYAGELLGLDRVVLTRLDDGTLRPESAYVRDDVPAAQQLLDRLADEVLSIAYPAVEGEILRRRRAERLDGPAGRRLVIAGPLGWTEHVVAPIVLESRVVGFLHADAARGLGDDDAVALAGFALCFAVVFERSILRRRLRQQADELRRMTAWAQARSAEPSERELLLSRTDAEEPAPSPNADAAMSRLRDLLTRREQDVLQLMVAGQTNAGIARELVLSEGTVKFHVKNVLRKLHATNRAEATSRYLRLTLGRAPKEGTP